MIWIVGGQRVHSGELTTGDLVAFALVLSVLYAPINGPFGAASGIVFEAAALSRILELFVGENATAPNAAAPSAVALPSGPASISLRNISFSHGAQVMFDKLNMFVPAGACELLTGRNGVGKSTLMSLVFSAPPIHSASIFLDEVALASFALQGHGTTLGYLPQEILIYSDTLRNNIAMGRPISDDQIMQLARELELEEFLRSWPGQLDLAILEGGRNMSGGQKQRLGLLRTLVGSPAIVLPDEPEKNLDQQSLGALVDYVKRLKQRCTCVIATHCSAFDAVVDMTFDLSGKVA